MKSSAVIISVQQHILPMHLPRPPFMIDVDQGTIEN